MYFIWNPEAYYYYFFFKSVLIYRFNYIKVYFKLLTS